MNNQKKHPYNSLKEQQKCCNYIWTVEYSKVNVKLTDTQLKILKTAVKNNTGRTLRISLKMFDGKDQPRELLLTTRQRIKLRNAFNNNMSTDIKLSKTQVCKII